jgi:hexosaminidase
MGNVFFSYPREVLEVISGDVKFAMIQGDYGKMYPNESFKSILPGGEVKIRFVARGFTQNKTDVPSGLYFIINGKPIIVKKFTAKPILNSGVKNLTAEELFEKYERTTDLSPNDFGRILPTPVSTIAKAGEFTINEGLTISADDAFLNEARLLGEDLKTIFGRSIAIVQQTDGNQIILQKIAGLPAEAYELDISSQKILIKASDAAGAFYATKSLVNLFPPKVWLGRSEPFNINALTVKDQPRFGYRSFLMDVARNFQSKDQVKKVIDLMSIYKLNTLHFHLNDDEGWRLEIPALPELIEVGAKRAHNFTNANLQPSYGSGPSLDNSAGTGYYSKADFIEILKYAAQRHIQIIPEIETPGHARAAIKSMLYRYEKYTKQGNRKAAEEFLLVELDDRSVHKSVQGFTDNIMNVALPSTYHFIETVVDELLDMYGQANVKLNTIHIGGDEVPNGTWQKSKAAQQLIADKTIENIDDLWYYYLNNVSKMLAAKNLQIAGWEEISLRKTKLNGKSKHIVNAGFVNSNFKVYVWNTAWGRGNEDLAYKIANAGYKTVLAPVTNFYFDLAYNRNNDETGLYWGGYVDTDKPYYFVPFDHYQTAKEDYRGKPVDKRSLLSKERLTDFGKSNILGLQCLLWSEKVTDADQMEYMLFPKLLGFAERAWGASPAWAEEKDTTKSEQMYNDAWSVFANQLGKKELPKLAYYLTGVNYRIPPVGLRTQNGLIHANVQFPGLQIRYTTDGTEPNMNSKLYTAPIAYQKGAKFKAFNETGRYSSTTNN